MTLVCSIAPFFLLLTCSSLAFASSIFLFLLQCSVLGLPMTVRSHSSGCSICTHLAEAFSYQVPFWILPCKVLELFSVSNFQEKNRTKLLALGLLETVFPQAHKILIFFFFFYFLRIQNTEANQDEQRSPSRNLPYTQTPENIYSIGLYFFFPSWKTPPSLTGNK